MRHLRCGSLAIDGRARRELDLPADAARPTSGPLGDLRVNVFAIGREKGEENQLTALLGALFRRDPEALSRFLDRLGIAAVAENGWQIDVELVHSRGRFDLVLTAGHEAIVVIESKIHTALAHDQVDRYLRRLAAHTEPVRALVLLTHRDVHVAEEEESYASAHGIQLHRTRWQQLAECLPDPEVDSLAGDFAALLVSEDLAAPPAVGADDWRALHGAPRAFQRIERLVDATGSRIATTHGFVARSRARASGLRRVTLDLQRDALRLRIGVAASDAPRRPETPPMIWVGLTDESVPADRRRGWAEDHAAALHAKADGGWIVRRSPAGRVLVTDSFEEQLHAFGEFATALLDEGRRQL